MHSLHRIAPNSRAIDRQGRGQDFVNYWNIRRAIEIQNKKRACANRSCSDLPRDADGDIEMTGTSVAPSKNEPSKTEPTASQFFDTISTIQDLSALTTSIQISTQCLQLNPGLRVSLGAIQAKISFLRAEYLSLFAPSSISDHGFVLFPLLPAEIRALIWQYAFPEPRLVEVEKYWRGDVYEDEEGEERYQKFRIKAIPPIILSVCRESRNTCLKHYSLKLGNSSSVDTPFGYHWFNANRDTIFIPFSWYNCTQKDLVTMIGVYAAQRIRYLAFDIHYGGIWKLTKTAMRDWQMSDSEWQILDFSDFLSLQRVDLITEVRRMRRKKSIFETETLIDYTTYETDNKYRNQVDQEWGTGLMGLIQPPWQDKKMIKARKIWADLRQDEFPKLHFKVLVRPAEDQKVQKRNDCIHVLSHYTEGEDVVEFDLRFFRSLG